MFKTGLSRLIEGSSLSRHEARAMMDALMNGEATPIQISGFLSILRLRGETVDELTGFVESMRAHVDMLAFDGDVFDTCGTGGDGTSTFNISTAVALLMSAMGVKVAKHGNRAFSSKSGSADVLEELGIPVQMNKLEAQEALKNTNLCFLYAPLYHGSMKYAASTRKELGFRTVFNILGPLVNPAASQRQLIGVFNFDLARKMAATLQTLGIKRAMLVTGDGNLDELSITGPSQLILVTENEVQEMSLAPEDVGLARGSLEDIQVTTIQESAEIIEAIFSDTANVSALNIVLLNTGAALFTAEKVRTIEEGVAKAREAITSGQARHHLERLRAQNTESLIELAER